MLEREGELEQSASALTACASGEGGMLAFVGPAGIGKSELLSALVREARQRRIRVLQARGTELERDFAFGIARQLFEPVIAEASADDRAALFDGAGALVAPLLDPASGAEAAFSLDPSFGSLHGLYWLTANLASREPLLIVVDDAHWADRASLRWLVHLAGRLEGVSALLAIAIREPEPGLDEPLLDELIAQPGCERIMPRPLSTDGVGRLTSESLSSQPDPVFIRACKRSTGGNPFLLRELLAELALDGRAPNEVDAALVDGLGPRNVARSVLGRIGRLPDSCLDLATALAVLGDGTPLTIVARLAGLDRAEAANAVDQLVVAGILGRSGSLGFGHPIVAAAVRSDLPPQRREALHREAARLLAESGSSPGRVAVHLLPTEPRGDSWVLEQLLAAAGEAFTAGALDQAEDCLRRALRELEGAVDPGRKATALSLLGWIEAVKNEEHAAIDHLSEALELTREPVQRATLARGLSSVLVAVNSYVQASEVLEQAIAGLGDDEVALGLRLEGELGLLQWLSREVRGRQRERSKRFTANPDEVAGGLLLACDALEAALYGSSAEPAARLAGDALFDGGLLAQETADSPAFYVALGALCACDALELGREVGDQAVAEASERGSLRGRAAARCWRAPFNLRLGRIEECLEDSRSALETGVAGPLLPMTVAHLVEALRERGDLEAAEAALSDHDPHQGASGEELLFQYFRLARIRLRLAQGQIDLGLEEAAAYEEIQREWDWPNDGGLPRRGVHAELLLAAGEREEALRLARDELEHARAFGPSRPIGMALRVCGLAEGGEPGVVLLREATRVLASSPARLEEARALVDLGAAIRRSGAKREAREPLNRALALARRCGGLAAAERAYEELLAAGAKPRKILESGVEALTPSESRVARMAADGRTNKEIAQELFVTVRTVETHLHNVFQKLDVGSRTELPEALADD